MQQTQSAKQEDSDTTDKYVPFRLTQPEGISAQLYAYQRETLTWMKVRTHSLIKPCYAMPNN